MECTGGVCNVVDTKVTDGRFCTSDGVCQVVDTNDAAHIPLLNNDNNTKFVVDPITAIIGDEIEDNAGNLHKTKDIVQGKIVGLYFSAIWCPPCRVFSPILANFYQKNASDFVVIYVGSDRSEEDMRKNLKEKPFFALPHKSSIKQKLSSKYNVSMIPTLAIISPKGELITDWGRSAVTKNPENCIKEWKQLNHGVSWYQLLKFF